MVGQPSLPVLHPLQVKNGELRARCRSHWMVLFCATLFGTGRKPLILKRRDVRVVEGARLEIALAVCDGVLRISITVAKPTT